MQVIDSFRGEHFFLSNFYPRQIFYKGRWCRTTEHAYQAEKFSDLNYQTKILSSDTPGKAKRLGQTKKIPLHPDWEKVKLDVMLDILRVKFAIPDLREKLLATGDAELIEANTWGDQFWGVYAGKGFNHLGRLLMQVRNELRYTPLAA